MSREWKVGGRFSTEGVVTALPDSDGDYRALFDGHTADGCVIAAEMAHAKLIAPEPRIPEIKVGQRWLTRGGEKALIIATEKGNYAFRYKDRWATRLVTKEGWHSCNENRTPDAYDLVELLQEAPEPKPDTSKPMRRKGTENEILHYLHENPLGQIYCRDAAGYVVLAFADDLENIPEPKIMGRREAVLLSNGDTVWATPSDFWHRYPVIGRAWVDITEGDGMEAEE